MVYLAYAGMQDMFLTEEPDFTHFKTVYTRDIQSTTKVLEQPFDQTSYRPGDTLICTLSQNGDFVTDVSLKVILPQILENSDYWVYPDYLKFLNKTARFFDQNGNLLYELVLNGLLPTTQNSYWVTPRKVSPSLVVTKTFSVISCGFYHTMCIDTTGGSLYAFGYNSTGQLGNGTSGIGANSTPTLVPIDVSVSKVSCGWYHTGVVSSSGALYMFGNNSTGQIGNGTSSFFDPVTTPTMIVSSGVSSVSGGYEHTAYVTTSGALYTFGSDSSGQLGNGASTGNVTTPAMIVASGVSSVSCGERHTAYVTTSGALYTFGYNGYGQLGDGTNTDRNTPTLIAASGVASVSCGANHTAYVTTSGALYTFGYNGYGQLGDGTNTDTNTPTLIAASGVASVSCGERHTAYVTTSGALYTFGYNGYGQLGDGTNTDTNTPTLIAASGVATVSCGGNHTAYATTSGVTYTTGLNNYGQLGDDLTTNKNTFDQPSFSSVPSLFNILGDKFVFVVPNSSCYVIFDDTETANFWGFVYNSVNLLGNFVRFNNVNSNQVTFQESGWLSGDRVYNPSNSYLDDTMYKLINSVSLYIGKQIVQEFDSKTLKFFKDTTTSYKNRPVLKLLEGNDDISAENRTYYFDIPFIDVPFHALPRHDIQIRIRTNPLNYVNFYASLILSYSTFSVQLPSEYTIYVPQVTYFSGLEKIDVRGPIKKLVTNGGSPEFKLLLNGEFFADEKTSKPSIFENLINTPTDSSNVIVFNNSINMSRIRDQIFRTSNVSVYAETTNVLKISNELAGIMYDTTESSRFPVIIGNLTNPVITEQTYMFDEIPLTVPNMYSFCSMRVVNPAYTGPVVRVRNETSDEEADLYTDSTQSYLKTSDGTTVSDFANGSNLRVVTWYDQSIEKNNMIQINKTVQPLLSFIDGKYVIGILNDTQNPNPILPNYWLEMTTPVHAQQFAMTVKFNSLYGYDGAKSHIFSRQKGYLRIPPLQGEYNAGDWISWPQAGEGVFSLNGTEVPRYSSPVTNTWYTFTGYHPAVYFGGDIDLIGVADSGSGQKPSTSMNGYFFEFGFMSDKTLKFEYDNYYANRPPVF